MIGLIWPVLLIALSIEAFYSYSEGAEWKIAKTWIGQKIKLNTHS